MKLNVCNNSFLTRKLVTLPSLSDVQNFIIDVHDMSVTSHKMPIFKYNVINLEKPFLIWVFLLGYFHLDILN